MRRGTPLDRFVATETIALAGATATDRRAVDRRSVLRAGHAGPVSRYRAVRRDSKHDATGLRQSGYRAGLVLQQATGDDRHTTTVLHRPLGQVRGRRQYRDERHVVRVRGAVAGVRREAQQTRQEEKKTRSPP